MTCDFQQCDILTGIDSDEPLQPTFKLRNSNDVQSVCAGWSEPLLVAHTTLFESHVTAQMSSAANHQMVLV